MKKKTGNKQFGWKIAVSCAGLAVVVSAGIGIYQYKKAAAWNLSSISAYVTQIQSVIGKRTSSPAAENTKNKSLTNVKLTEQPIHFEFYTALPNMQMTMPLTTIETKQETPKPSIVTNSVVTAEELDRELSASSLKERFLVQLGIFKNPSSAKHYRETLQNKGINTTIMEVVINKKRFYRVQLGPYDYKNQAGLTKQKLQAQGITGVVYKLN